VERYPALVTESLSFPFRGVHVRIDGSGAVFVSHRLRLIVTDGPSKGLEREVAASRVLIGSGHGNDIVLDDSAVSRRHCEIVATEGGYVVRDLASKNGTFIDGIAVMEAPVPGGAHIRLGRSGIVFQPASKAERLEQSAADRLGDLVAASAAMRGVFDLVGKIAPTELSCIVIGETGTGKELIARAIHRLSDRSRASFVVVDCAALADPLHEAELFGHERGAFTGADRARAGAFERAHGGTVFLDEIGELPPQMQKSLLRALEHREIKRLGAAEYIDVNVRVVTATHRDLTAMVRAGAFREDLFYRLAEIVIEVPPLRERRDDILPIAREILARAGAEQARRLDEGASELLVEHAWPGNVRELRNVLRRASALTSSRVLGREDLLRAGLGARGPSSAPPTAFPPAPAVPREAFTPVPPGAPPRTLRDVREGALMPAEKEYLERLMGECDWDLRRAAQQADIHPKSLARLLRQHGLRRPRRR